MLKRVTFLLLLGLALLLLSSPTVAEDAPESAASPEATGTPAAEDDGSVEVEEVIAEEDGPGISDESLAEEEAASAGAAPKSASTTGSVPASCWHVIPRAPDVPRSADSADGMGMSGTARR